MGYIKFLNDKNKYSATVSMSQNSEDAIRVEFDDFKIENTSGFEYYIGTKEAPIGVYEEYNYIYKNDEHNVIEFSRIDERYKVPTKDITININWNDSGDIDKMRPSSARVILYRDGSKYKTIIINKEMDWTYTDTGVLADAEYSLVVPEINEYKSEVNGLNVTATHEHVETVDELIQSKIAELEADCTSAIEAGQDIEISIGTEHFNYSQYVQNNLNDAYNTATALIAAGHPDVKIPFYNGNNVCKEYSLSDIITIYWSMTMYKTHCITLLQQLIHQLNTMTNADDIDWIKYDTISFDEEHLEVFNSFTAKNDVIMSALKEQLVI